MKQKQKFLDLKVYINKRNGQSMVILSKKSEKKMGKKIPPKVKVKW